MIDVIAFMQPDDNIPLHHMYLWERFYQDCLLFQLIDLTLAFNCSCQGTIFIKSERNINCKFPGI